MPHSFCTNAKKHIIWHIFIVCMIIGQAFVFSSCKVKSETAVVKEEKHYYQCPMDPQIITDHPASCPICGMKLVSVDKNKAETVPDGMVKIDPSVVHNMGVAIETVTVRSLNKDVRTSATIQINERAQAIVNTKIMGWVEKLYVDYTGQSVTKGQPLLILYSPDLVSAQEEYLQALRYLNSLPGGAQNAARTGAEELVVSSKRRLMNWDISEKEITDLEQRGTANKTMTVYAPFGGVVLEKMVVAGQNVMPGMALYKIADLSTVWAIANVFQDDLPYIKLGMQASVEISQAQAKTVTGIVQFIAPVLDPVSKTAGVRIAIKNSNDYSIKPEMVGQVLIQSPQSKKVITVSEQSVIKTGKRNVVVVSLGNGYFKTVEVECGMSAGGYVEIISGLTEGQIVVTSSQFLIDSESNLKEAVKKMSGGE